MLSNMGSRFVLLIVQNLCTLMKLPSQVVIDNEEVNDILSK